MPPIATLDQFDFHHVLAETPGPALVFFTAANCSACHALRRALEAYLNDPGGLAVFEVDAQRDAGLTREFEVFHLPSMFLFVDGQYHCELQSEARAPALRLAIEQALAREPEEAP